MNKANLSSNSPYKISIFIGSTASALTLTTGQVAVMIIEGMLLIYIPQNEKKILVDQNGCRPRCG
ncbi:hypothetical protein KIN20_010646 [Parelaphostrongylus tenuis]|uniref:Uncharacterized protein n=1 Tax=Parelaphostrongylus tenuis TaxID=148309 RepID=A0AAD5QKD7_PARTN|nr:hypothetical protein KIN20_010646 [Parelaphostrongylus tenuis]